MKYITLFLGILAIAAVTIINFYPDEVRDFFDSKFGNNDFVIAKTNDYYLDNNYAFVQNYTDDVSNKQELINYIYYVINSGSEYADGECTRDYSMCIDDLKEIAADQKTLSIINNFVHPYNSFKTISFTYNSKGNFSMAIEHIYSQEDIDIINGIVDNEFDNLIDSSMSTTDKIKNIHDYVINKAKYDTLKSDNIYDNTYKSNTAYGVLVQGYGICSGYSDTIAIFLDKLGIKNYKISNDTHIWNLVYVNGVWVHLDATWDDPISESNENRDTYFLINNDTLEELDDDTHSYDKEVYIEAY